jgi:hypothetical protein
MLFLNNGLPQFLHCQHPTDLQILIQTGSSSTVASILGLQPHFPATPSCCEAVPPCEEMSVRIIKYLQNYRTMQHEGKLVNWNFVGE